MNQAFEEKLQSDLDALKKAGTYKHLRHITTPMAPEVHMEEAGDVIVLSSNNYLGLADQPEVVEAGKRGLEKYGAGTASVRFICGTFDIHRVLEQRIADFLGTQASLSYVACWNANTGLFPTICDQGSAIISDELNHASIIDGVRLATKARRERFKHSDMGQLEEKLKSVQGCFPIVIVTDGVFSMEGDLAKLPEMSALAKKYGAITVVDDSHGTGVMGKTGRGTIEHYGLTGEIDVITGTLGKALGGAAGGFVAGSNALDRYADSAFEASVVLQRVAGDGCLQRFRSHRISGCASRAGRPAARKHAIFSRRIDSHRLQAARQRKRDRTDNRGRNGLCNYAQRPAAQKRNLRHRFRLPGCARRNRAHPRADQRRPY